MREEPLIPLGMGLTIAAFIGASRAMRKGDSKRLNMMFRRRIYAQAFTVCMIVAGSFYMADEKAKRKKLEELDRQKRTEETREKWLGELEIRDEEDKIARERVEKLMQRRKNREEDLKKKDSGLTADSASSQVSSTDDDQHSGREGRLLDKAREILGQGKPKK
jgi:hypothetical protein